MFTSGEWSEDMENPWGRVLKERRDSALLGSVLSSLPAVLVSRGQGGKGRAWVRQAAPHRLI